MLSSNELSKLYKIISDENQTFENISKSFEESFNKCDHMKIAISVCILIKDNLLNIHQRIISFYLLYLIQKSDDLDFSPFLPLIIEIMQKSKNITEQNFILDFLSNQINYLNTSVKNYLQDNTKSVKINIPHLQMLYEKYNSIQNKIGNNKKTNDYIRHVLYDRKKSDIKNIDNHSNIDIHNTINIEDELSFKFFEPNYMSFLPKSLNMNKKIFDMEPFWVIPNLNHNFIWENENMEEMKKMMNEEKKLE